MSLSPRAAIVAAVLFGSGAAEAKISGTVQFLGTPPPPTRIDMRADPACLRVAKDRTQRKLRVQDGKLAEVVVFVRKVPPADFPRGQSVVLDQVGCRFSPRVLGIAVGQSLTIKNSDPTLHSVRADDGAFHLAMPKMGQRLKRTFEKPGRVALRSDVHPWMVAQVWVFDHPFFAVSDDAGRFNIDVRGLPDGAYELVAWHAEAGQKTLALKLVDGAAQARFAFGGAQ